MAIVRWEPFRDLVGLQERMNRLFEQSFRGLPHNAPGDDEWSLGGTWAPAVDIFEQDGNIVMKAELPGIDSKDVDIRLENNVLTLRGERKIDNEVKRESYHRVERAYGAFQRAFTLPGMVEQDKVKAKFKDGILEIVLPKAEKAKPKQVKVEVG